MANVTSLPVRAERHYDDHVWATWQRITEDGDIERVEIVEMAEALGNQRHYVKAIVSEHAVTQAMPRATDPVYVGRLVAAHQQRMAVLPDARDAA